MTGKTTEQIDRSNLREMIQEKLDDDEFWMRISGNDIESAKSLGQSLMDDDCHLDRLLVARNFDPEATVALFWEQVEFRAKYKPDHISPEDIPVALPSGAWRCCGFRKDGQVISNYKLEHWNPQEYDDDIDKAMEEYTLYVCYFVELMLRCGKDANARFSLIFDLNGFYYGMVTQEKVRRMIARLIYVAQAQYPERLGRVYLVNAPCTYHTSKCRSPCFCWPLTIVSLLSWVLNSLESHPGTLRRQDGF